MTFTSFELFNASLLIFSGIDPSNYLLCVIRSLCYIFFSLKEDPEKLQTDPVKILDNLLDQVSISII